MYKELFAESGLSLDRLRSLCQIAAAGGISKAAADNPVKQSQFSRQVRELESFFKTELTARKGRNMVLTPAGVRLAALSREVFSALNDFKSAQHNRPVDISVGAGESFLQWLLLPKMKKLRAQLPNAVFTLRNRRTEQVVTALQEANLDFGIIRADAVPKGLKGHRLCVVRYHLFVSSHHAVGKKRLNWQQALSLPFVGLEGDGQFMTKLGEIAKREEIAVQTAILCSSLPAMAAAVRELDAVAILPSVTVFPDLAQIEAPFLREFDREMRLVWNPRQSQIRPVMERARTALLDALDR